MPIVPTQEILGHAFRKRYGVAAINVVNDLTLKAVLTAAQELRAPLIVQTSVATIRAVGLDLFYAMWLEMARPITVPVALHLDHCPDRGLISACLAKGWNSVLFDGSGLSLEDNRRQCIEVVAEARRTGAAVEGEIEAIDGTEDGVGPGARIGTEGHPLEASLDFIDATGIDCFAPAIGNVHGTYRTAPKLNLGRVSDIVAARPIPIALHGGTGLSPQHFKDLIARGCAKVNISTALRVAYTQSSLDYLAGHPSDHDPSSLFRAQSAAVVDVTKEHIRMFGGEGQA